MDGYVVAKNNQLLTRSKLDTIIAHDKQIAMVILLQKAIDCPHYQITINIICPLPVLIVGNLVFC